MRVFQFIVSITYLISNYLILNRNSHLNKYIIKGFGIYEYIKLLDF